MFNQFSSRLYTLLTLFLLAFSVRALAADIDVSVSPVEAVYENGKVVEYEVSVKNNTASRIQNVAVQYLVWDTLASTESGSGKAFTSLTTTASFTYASEPGTYASTNDNLDVVDAELFPYGSIVYRMQAKVSDDVTGTITLPNAKVSLDVDGDGTPEQFESPQATVFNPVPYQYNLSLSVDKPEYVVGQTLTYTLTATNTGEYAVQGLDIAQAFKSLSVENISGDSVSPFSSVSISGKESGSSSELGTFATSDNLNVTDAKIDVGGSLTYTILATVADDLVGDIVTSASSTTKDGVVISEERTTPPAKAEVTITHSVNKTSSYLVGEQRVFNIEVKNTGAGVAHDFNVKHNIDSVLSTLGLGNNLQSEHNHTDVTGNPFATWTIRVTGIGANSHSSINETGTLTDVAFDDTISLYPNESISYEIAANISPVAIGDIQGLTASLYDQHGDFIQDDQVSSVVSAERVLNVDDSEISIKKTTSASQYVPGQTVEYDITVSNSSSKYFANNLKVVDDLTCVTTDQAAGAGVGQAFKRWKLEPASSEDDQGTDPGSYNYGAWTTSPITMSPDIAPGKTVQYKLTAEVNDSSVGLILDDASCSDNVSEEGSGVQMPDDNLRASKDVDNRYYSAGDVLTYTIRIDNDGDGFANMVPVVDEISTLETVSTAGKIIPAFMSWEITAEAYRSDGSAATSTDTGISGTLTNPDDLNVQATLEPHSYIIYTIKAKIHPLANGHIQNSVTVDGTVYADRGSDPRDFTLQMSKAVKTNNDSSFHGEQTSYAKQETEVTYQVRVKNPKGNGYATNVRVVDEISNIQAELLEPDTTTKQVFSSWMISAEIVSDNPLLNGNSKFTDVGTFEDNKDLDTVAQIPPNVEIIYTIVAQIDRSNGDEIVYGEIKNTARVETPDSDSQSQLSDTALVKPKTPDVVVVKTTDNDNFVPGEWVDFKVSVYNRGAGYANEVAVNDDIIGMNAFSEWKITSATDDNNSPFKTGSYAGSKSNYPDNGNINTKVDIDPKTAQGMGFVTYTIRGLVRNDYDKEEISNTVEIRDPATGLNQSASAEIGDSGEDKLNVSIVKTADKTLFVPGEDVIYSIYVQNNSANTANELKLVDRLTEIKAVLANDKDKQYPDYYDQSPFEYWEFDYGDGAGWQGQTTEDLVYPPGSDSTSFSLKAGETREFKIRARVKDNVVGSLNASGSFDNILANDAYIYRDFKEVTQQSHVSHHEMRRINSGGNTTRELLVNGVSSRYYAPGDTLTYKVKVSSQKGYYNNHKVSENIKDVDVLLLDGSKANPFEDVFSVAVEKEDSNGGDGTTDGTLDGIVKDNENINTTIDVAGDDYVLYTVEGVVREDAAGNITIGGITVEPYDYHLVFSKTTEQKNYQPGSPLTYHLTIKNDGKGSAYNIPIIDELSTIEVGLLDGTQGPAFPDGWTIVPNVVGGNPAAEVDLDGTIADNKDISTHMSVPAGETIDYTVTATVNKNAVGEILNLLRVDGDTVSAQSKADTQKYDFSKHVTKVFDTDGTTELTGGYTPGGYIQYEIMLKNLNNAHLKDVPVVDDIRGITTDYFDGTIGAAFDSWQISSEVDSSGLSDAGSVTDNDNINTSFNLAGNSFADGGTYVKYTIKAKISEKAVGPIENVAKVNDKHTLTSERVDMLAAELTKSHVAYTDSSFATKKTTYNHTADGEKVVYRLRLENNGKGTEYGASLKEQFSKIASRLAQDATGEVDDQQGATFDPFGWNVKVTKSDELVTDIAGYAGGANSDIDIATLSLAPGGWVEFVVETQIRPDALGDVVAKPYYNGSVFQASTIKSDADDLEVTKTIVSIGGRPYSSGDSYKPGEEVIYNFNVNNKAKVWADQTEIRDIVSDITVEVLGGTTEQAFDTFSITNTMTVGLGSGVDTYLPAYDANDDLSLMVDIAPSEEVHFVIKGTIRDDALGVIDANHALGGSHSVSTPTIPPIAPQLEFEKLVTNTTADGGSCTFPSSTGENCEYNPGGLVSYQVMIKNTGESIANDVAVIDELSTIKTSTGSDAFSSFSTTVLEQPDADRFDINGNYAGSVPLNATIDLMPGDRVVFGLQGTVDDDATGTITNVAQVGGQSTNEVVLDQGEAEIRAMKFTDTPTYVPGGEVRFTMLIANTTDSNADVRVEDAISKFMVETADGSMQTALKSWTTTTSFISNASATHNDASAIQTTGDIDAIVKLGAADVEPTVLKIDVVGLVRDDAVGKFGNTLYVDSIQYDLREHFIYPQPGQLNVTKDASISPALYAPGDSIGFDIVVENTGSGYLQNVLIEDLASDIKASVVDSMLPSHVFDSWDASKSSITIVPGSASETVTIEQSDFDSADGFTGKYNLAPGAKIELHLEGTVKGNVIGEITNTVKVSADNLDPVQDSATYLPIDADITVSKEVDKSIYQARDTLTYTITLTNTQRVWATDVYVKDLVNAVVSDTIYGTSISVFETGSIEIDATSKNGTTTLPALSGAYIDNRVDIAPEDVVTITVKGTLKPEIIGEVRNVVSVEYDGKTIEDDAISTPLIPSIVVTKTPYEEYYTPGTLNGFVIQITNQDAAFASDIEVKDLLTSMMVETADGVDRTGFSRWTYHYEANDPMTQVDSLAKSWNSDINDKVDLAPNDTITYVIAGEVDEKAVGEITNTANVEFNSNVYQPSAVIKPKPSAVTLQKTADQEFYQAGQPATFTITVSNDGEGIADNVHIQDIMSNVLVTLVDGTTGPAFESWTITTSSSDAATTLTSVPSGKNPDIDTYADIAPLSNVTFTINGVVNRYATTDIYNQAIVDLTDSTQLTADATILNRPISLTIEKFVGETGTNTEEPYEPGKESTFRVVLTNQNEAFASGIQLRDLVDSMKVETTAGTLEPVFDNWSIEVKKGNELTSIAPDPSGSNRNVDAVVQLAPKDTLELVIKGKVNDYAIGQIDNKASMTVNTGHAQHASAIASLLPEPDNVIITKVADDPIYTAGEKATFRIKLFNDSKGFANDVVLKDMMSRIKVQTRPDLTTGNRDVVNAFTDWTIDVKSNDSRSKLVSGSISANSDVDVAMDIAPGDTAEFVITGTVDPRAMGEIINTAHKIDEVQTESRDVTVETVSAMITPKSVSFVIDKTTTKGDAAEYTNDDDELTYILRISNEGSSLVSGAQMVDEISKLAGANGNSLFTSWTMKIEEWPTGTVIGEYKDVDLQLPQGGLSLDLQPYMGNGYVITITGEINKGLDDDITNTFTVTDPATGVSASDDVTIHVKKFADNEGDLFITKEALKTGAQVGDVVEYEVIIQNNNESEFKGVKLVDRYPAGFAYVQGSTEMTKSGPDGQFDTADDVYSKEDPTVTRSMTFNVGDMLAYGGAEKIITEKVRIRYLLRVTVGVTFGKYVNTAVAMTPPEGQVSGALVAKSNTATATVEILPDKLFDSASIIGKVFEDHNRDGFQADATAFDVVVSAKIPTYDYVPGSTVVIRNGREMPVKDVEPNDSRWFGKRVQDTEGAHLNYRNSSQHSAKSALVQGFEISKLYGVSRNRTLPDSNKMVFQFSTKTNAGISLTVESKGGTRVLLHKDGTVTTEHVGDRNKGLSAENLDVTRNLYKDGDEYLWEIVIENKGIYEDGIPGIRLLTVEGIVIETDQYGRYHVPDQWVLDKKGKNFLVKVDTDSLPTGMKVISENPRVQRISPNKLTKFNFSVAVDEKQ